MRYGIPKGRILPIVIEILNISRPHSRELFIKTERDIFFFLKPQSICELIKEEKIDVGFVTSEILYESNLKLNIIEKFKKHQTRISLCSLSEDKELNNSTIATEYPLIARRYLERQNKKAKIVTTKGSTESYLFLGYDFIIDLVDTGETLRMNNIKEIEKIFVNNLLMVER